MKDFSSYTGTGTHNLEKIFDIEEKFQTDDTDGEKGTGPGLIICKEFVEMNKGMIEIFSIPGKGSFFSFTTEELFQPGSVNRAGNTCQQ